jgi:cellulose synthase/poly-beta-1,6-N-acetylglucosamine synthase-like glycosyltransferase
MFHEANMVDQLTRALIEIDHPPSLLDIKLVLEEDDEETIAAVRARALPGTFEVILVPACEPHTKPKALNFALPFARGELLVIYDAEDIPDRDQLRRAANAFHQGSERLACLQAALAYYNTDQNWLTGQFAIEYACLFDVIVPRLAAAGLPLPLGGTSNHFRTSILRQAGGWDPHNVTEDANIGFRLNRMGYRVEALYSTTHEEAVWRAGDWTRQRSRWLKGWIQTWFVHNRSPLKLLKEVGFLQFFVLQILLLGTLISAVGYPLFLSFIVFQATTGSFLPDGSGLFSQTLFALQLWVLIAGFGVNMVVGWVALNRRGLSWLAASVFFMPFYWLMISFASWRAIGQFCKSPFYWEKTGHGDISTLDP